MLSYKSIKFALLASVVFCTACQTPPPVQKSEALPAPNPMVTTTSDNVRVFGESYFGNLGSDTPLILLFHQGGSNGRGEYEPLAEWLNQLGYRAIAWDQRSGGETYGRLNRTKLGLSDTVANGFCDASADLQAALDFVKETGTAQDVIVWGSSYSAALAFELAANNPEAVKGLIAFSPASGGQLAECRARQWVGDIKSPMLVLRPASEMERESSQEQKTILSKAGVAFHIVDDGIHGSSMLVDERTEHNMSKARQKVADWLKKTSE